MLVCRVCGEVFDESEVIIDSDVNCKLCPECHSLGVSEANKCEICGEYFYDEDNIGVCESCLDDNHDVETAFKYGADRMESVAVNGAIYALLTESEINAILTKYVEEHFTDDSRAVANYCNEDKYDFANWLMENNK